MSNGRYKDVANMIKEIIAGKQTNTKKNTIESLTQHL